MTELKIQICRIWTAGLLACSLAGSAPLWSDPGSTEAAKTVRSGATSEPGTDAFLSDITGSSNRSPLEESFDGFSGSYVLRMTSVDLPGHGGLDLVVQQSYRPNVWNRVESDAQTGEFIFHQAGIDVNDLLGGNGWQLHMGKVRNPWGEGSPADYQAPDNPVVRMPDGSSHALYRCQTHPLVICGPGDLVTEAGWVYRRVSPVGAVPVVWELTLDSGVVMVFESAVGEGGFQPGCFGGPCYAGPVSGAATSYVDLLGGVTAQCTAIRDLNGNEITVEYDDFWGRPERVTDSYGRVVDFDYVDGANAGEGKFPLLEKLTVKTSTAPNAPVLQTWRFTYHDSFSVIYEVFLGTERFDLERQIYPLAAVIPPAGPQWSFTYFGGGSSYHNGRRALEKLIYPGGATVTYDYKGLAFDVGHETGTIEQLVLERRTITGPGLPAGGTWSYTYTDPGEDGQKTTVTGPQGFREVSEYHGWTDFDPPSPGEPAYPDMTDPMLFQVGLLKSRKTTLGPQTETWTYSYAPGATMLSSDVRTTTAWNGFLGVNAGRVQFGVPFLVPSEVKREIKRGTKTYTTTRSSFDDYGNPRTITESGDLSRTTSLIYWYNKDLNLIAGQVSLTRSTPGGRERRWYTPEGRLEKRMVNATTDPGLDGLETRYTYHGNGDLDLETVENASRDQVRKHESYRWGVATRITEGSGQEKVVYDHEAFGLGSLDKIDDGRGNRTERDYDGLGRVTEIRPPIGQKSVVTWAPDGTSVTVERERSDGHGSETKYSLDGLGRVTLREDRKTGDRLSIRYGPLGLKEEESEILGGIPGDTRTFDLLGRPTSIVHPDATSRSFHYEASKVTLTDEKNRITRLEYEAFGDPAERRLKKVTDAASNVWTYRYGSHGLLSDVDAPGATYDRSFHYDSRHLLEHEDHPETGRITYRYWKSGDLKERETGTSKITHNYDLAGRLVGLDVAGSAAEDVSYGYDGPLRDEVSNAAVTVSVLYDAAGRVASRTTEVAGQEHTLTMGYDTLDRLETLTYPSGRELRYHYHPNGRLQSVDDETEGRTLARDLAYHGGGALASLTLEGGVKTDYTFTDRFWIDEMSTSRGSVTLSHLDFDYDGAGNLETWTDELDDARSRGFGYDVLDRMKSATAPGLWGTKEYSYDAHGHRTGTALDGRQAIYGYDAAGRLETITSSGTVILALDYDGFGRVTRLERRQDDGGPGGEAHADFAFSCAGRDCTFDAGASSASGGIDRFEWDFGDGTPEVELAGEEPVVDHLYASADTYTVILRVTGEGGAVGTTSRQVVVVDGPPGEVEARFSASCLTLTCDFDASDSRPETGLTSYTWDFGDGATTTTPEPTVRHTYSSAGLKTVILTVSDAAGESDSVSGQVEPRESGDGRPTARFSLACQVLQCQLDAGDSTDDQGIVLYSWNFGDGSPEVETDEPVVTHLFPMEETYRVRLRVTDTAGQTAEHERNVSLSQIRGAQQTGSGHRLKAGAFKWWGYATSPDGIVEITEPGSNAQYHHHVEYGLPHTSCEDQQEAYGWSDPNCPNTRFRVTVNSRRAMEGVPMNGVLPFYWNLSLRDAADRVKYIEYMNRLIQSGDEGPPRVEHDRPNPCRLEEAESGPVEQTYTGWAVDDTGVLDLSFQPRTGPNGAPLPEDAFVVLEENIDVKRADACAQSEVQALQDPNCQTQQRVGWKYRIRVDPPFGDRPVLLLVTATDAYGNSTTGGNVFLEPHVGGVVRPECSPVPSDDFIEAEDFDWGEPHEAYWDATEESTGSSNYRHLGWVDLDICCGGQIVLTDTEEGEWLNYSLVLAESGTYEIEFRYQVEQPPLGEIDLFFHGDRLGNSILLPVTGPSAWGTQLVGPIYLQKDPDRETQVLRLHVREGGFRLNRFRIRGRATPQQHAFGPQAHAVPGVLELEEFDVVDGSVGQSIAYFDRDVGNRSEAPCREEEWLECSGANGPESLELDFEEWVEHTVHIASAGTYDLEIVYRNESETAAEVFLSSGVEPRAITALPPSAGQWRSHRVSGIELPPGGQVLRLAAREIRVAVDKVRLFKAQWPPVASFLAACDSASCIFNASSSSDDEGITSYIWNFGDGVSTSTSTPVVRHTYSTSGSYDVTLTVSDGGSTHAVVRTVVLDLAPTAQLSVDCEDLRCFFDASASSDDHGIETYRWDFADGTPVIESTEPTVEHAFAADGTYPVRLTVIDAGDRIDSTRVYVAVDDFELLFHLIQARHPRK